MFYLNLANSLLKKRCEAEFSSRSDLDDNKICVIVPKKGYKHFFNYKVNVIAANDTQDAIWNKVKDCTHIYVYDFDNLSFDTQQLIYHLEDKEIHIWAKPKYIRDPYNFADNDYLYKIYIDKTTTVNIVGNIRFQILPKTNNIGN